MFGGLIDPGDSAGEMLSAAIDRTKTDAYLKQAERVRILLSQQWGRIVDMFVEKAKEAAKISGDTGKELSGLSADLQDYLGSFETQALNFKGLHTPYTDKNGKEILLTWKNWLSLRNGHKSLEILIPWS